MSRSKTIQIRVSDEEFEAFMAQANTAGLAIGTWAREKLLDWMTLPPKKDPITVDQAAHVQVPKPILLKNEERSKNPNTAPVVESDHPPQDGTNESPTQPIPIQQRMYESILAREGKAKADLWLAVNSSKRRIQL